MLNVLKGKIFIFMKKFAKYVPLDLFYVLDYSGSFDMQYVFNFKFFLTPSISCLKLNNLISKWQQSYKRSKKKIFLPLWPALYLNPPPSHNGPIKDFFAVSLLREANKFSL